MPAGKALRHQILDGMADDLVMRVAEQSADLSIGEPDRAGDIDDDHRIRRSVERMAASSAGADSICYSSWRSLGPHKPGPA